MSKHIIAKRVNGQLRPSSSPTQHDTYPAALIEAYWLANANPGVEFVVLSESHSVMTEADIPTSTLYKSDTPPGVYQFVRFGDGANCEEGGPMPFQAVVGPAVSSYNHESNPVVFMDGGNRVMNAPKTRNVRWKLIR